VGGARDSLAASVLASLVQDPRGFEDPESLKETMEDVQVVAALTLKSEYVVSPSLSLECWDGTPGYSAWLNSRYARPI